MHDRSRLNILHLNILHPNLLPVNKLANEQLGVAKKLNIPLFRTASGQRTFYYRTIKLWNNLESFLKLSLSVKILNIP